MQIGWVSMKLSIIVPVYNMAKDNKLQFCIDSLLNQTIDDYEIIAVDDASTDESPEILKKYSEDYPDRVRLFLQKENKKQGAAKNVGLKAATGEWIGFIDSDDWVTPDYYEKLIGKAEATGADVVGCHYSIVHEHTFEVGDVVCNNSLDQAGFLDGEKHKKLFMQFGSMVIKVYKRNIIVENKLDFPEGIFYEDNCAGPIWSAYFSHFEMVDEPLYYYYQHSDSTVHTVEMSRLYNRMTACEILKERLTERGLYGKYHDELEYIFSMLYFKNTLFSYMLAKHTEGIGFVKKLKAGMLEHFPNFRKNKYYVVPDAEEARMIDLLMKNTTQFYVYYSLLWFYRRKIRHQKS